MSKQIYIDSDGNEVQVSGTVNSADMMPMSASDSTKVSEAIGDLSILTTTVKSSLVGAVNEIARYTPVYGNTASGAIAIFDTSLALSLQDLQIAINAVQENGTPSPSSPKAITGFTGANIKVSGKNLFDKSNSSLIYSGYINTGNQTYVSYNNTRSIVLKVKKGITYTVSRLAGTRFSVGSCDHIPNNDDTISNIATDNTGTALSITPTYDYLIVFFYINTDTSSIDDIINSIQIEIGNTATTYEAYNGTTTAITWNDEAGTVYGGELDVTTGLLTVTHKIVNMGDLSYTHYSVTQGELFRASLSDIKQITNQYTTPNALSDIYKAVNTTLRTNYTLSQAINTPSLDFINDDYNDAVAFKTAMQTANAKLVYELATPITYRLTPTQISAIVGTNNVFTDTNGDTSVMYACSLKDYIDSQ